jgi:hypothetical protein
MEEERINQILVALARLRVVATEKPKDAHVVH